MNAETVRHLQNRLVAQARYANWLAVFDKNPAAMSGAREYDLGRRDAFIQAARLLRDHAGKPFEGEILD